MNDNPLGKDTIYPDIYSPDLLHPIDREKNRDQYISNNEINFHGLDIWNAWEFSWLDNSGRPFIGKLTLIFPSNSKKIIESKSMKLYLNGFSNTQYDSSTKVIELIQTDLSQLTKANVLVTFNKNEEEKDNQINPEVGYSIDNEDANFFHSEIRTEELKTDKNNRIKETLYSEILRTNCPVTNQPDTGTVIIKYQGNKIHRGGLLSYISSYRGHNDFHESCVEKIFLDIKQLCRPDRLTVFARYNRRGGIDINPFRSDFEDEPVNLRLWRQ